MDKEYKGFKLLSSDVIESDTFESLVKKWRYNFSKIGDTILLNSLKATEKDVQAFADDDKYVTSKSLKGLYKGAILDNKNNIVSIKDVYYLPNLSTVTNTLDDNMLGEESSDYVFPIMQIGDTPINVLNFCYGKLFILERNSFNKFTSCDFVLQRKFRENKVYCRYEIYDDKLHTELDLCHFTKSDGTMWVGVLVNHKFHSDMIASLSYIGTNTEHTPILIRCNDSTKIDKDGKSVNKSLILKDKSNIFIIDDSHLIGSISEEKISSILSKVGY